MYECHNLVDSTEQGAWLQDPTITFLGLHRMNFWKKDFFDYAKSFIISPK
jgi:hypothetical protein